ncbi:DUF2169 domain-containing protein [Variovorax defluvii]|uniref:DUF2169 domain-containing protein n=1 Tax=Variovorax defluvii TaxID=913761 RepID=A0ABP8IAA8_9BURK
MWQLDNRTPYAAERTWVRDRDGAEIWIVAVKCSFDILADGGTVLAEVQSPVVQVPAFANPAEPARSSLRHDTDMVRTKLTTDVLLLGEAHAPGGVPVATLDVGFRVGPVVKRLRVTGDRVWLGGSPSEPEPFATMPLCYERAYGGVDPASRRSARPQWDARNPAGTGFVLDAAGAEGVRLPNIEYADRPVQGWSDRPAPAGFGPLGVHWQPRLSLAGTYDERWMRERQPLLPHDFDDRHYQCAPADQQSPQFLAGGEPVALVHLARQPELRFTLPRVLLRLDTFFSDGTRTMHARPRLHTVILEPSALRVSLVWHSALPCHTKVHKLQKTRIVEKRVLNLSDSGTAEALEG